MSLTKNWYTIEEASSKYGITAEQILHWVDRGLVRSEGKKGKINLVNSDDIELELGMVPSV